MQFLSAIQEPEVSVIGRKIANSTQPAGKQPTYSSLRPPKYVSHQGHFVDTITLFKAHSLLPVMYTCLLCLQISLNTVPALTNTNYAFRYCKPNVSSRVAESVVSNMDERTPLAASADPQFLVQIPATDQTTNQDP